MHASLPRSTSKSVRTQDERPDRLSSSHDLAFYHTHKLKRFNLKEKQPDKKSGRPSSVHIELNPTRFLERADILFFFSSNGEPLSTGNVHISFSGFRFDRLTCSLFSVTSSRDLVVGCCVAE